MIRRFKRQSKYLNKTDRAYAAGFFDGEGWVSVVCQPGKRPGYSVRYSITVGIGQKDPAPLHWLQNRWGGRIYSRSGPEPFYLWQLAKTEGIRFLRHILPHLKVKQDKARSVIEFAGLIKPRASRPSEEELALRGLRFAQLSERRYSDAALTTE